jgi:uncharacterized membrane-anchored protein YjiN (DUF445 family)
MEGGRKYLLCPMIAKRRNNLGSVSLLVAVGGFLAVELQPWLPLDAIGLFGGLTLKGLLEAFFEASMAGAVADWFAVTALFRDPLGVSLPHTNILAKNKDSIADGIPRFLTGFLRSDAVAAELAKVDYAAKAAEALADPANRGALQAFLSSRAAEAFLAYGPAGEGPDEAKVAALRKALGEFLDFAARRVDAPRAFASLLEWAHRERFDERAFEALAEYARLEIGRNRARIVSMLTPIVKRNAGWQGLFIGANTVERFVLGIQDELAEMKADKTNDFRRYAIGAIAAYAARLDGSSDGADDRERLAAAFREALADGAFRRGAADFAASTLARLGEELRGPEGRFIATLDSLETALASRLAADGELRSRLNAIVASLLGTVVERGRVIEGAADYVAGLLKSTDERYFVGKIEESVWDDLQYIRVNGAVVGGFVGLALALLKAAFA